MLLNLFDVVLGEHGRCVAHGFLGKCVYVREREREGRNEHCMMIFQLPQLLSSAMHQ